MTRPQWVGPVLGIPQGPLDAFEGREGILLAQEDLEFLVETVENLAAVANTPPERAPTLNSNPSGTPAKSRRGRAFEEALDLAKRAVRSPHWAWMDGMLVEARGMGRVRIYAQGHGTLRLGPDGSLTRTTRRAEGRTSALMPVLSDPGTRGALRELVYRAWPESRYTITEGRIPGSAGTTQYRCEVYTLQSMGRERAVILAAESLESLYVQALENAPERTRRPL